MLKSTLEEVLGFNPKTSSNELYALCDYSTLQRKNLTVEDFISLVKSMNVKIIQYRDKISSNDVQIKHLKQIKEKLNVLLLINDKVELVPFCDGIHLGQEDLEKIHENKAYAIKILRKKIKNKFLGLSTHNEYEILQANTLDIDMIGLGAYRNTSTKDITNILGDKISYLCQISKHPVCIIGGVKVDDKIEYANFNVVGSDLYE
ncbi:MAG: thiamine phosphate synthase [Campylobacteraceae bacterium]|nr:thiamine phosphate synthase [Campylobacteraceae bacterium]